MSCLKTTRISGPCSECGERRLSCHLDELTGKLFCSSCCPNCTVQVSIDWEHAPAPTLHGEQGGLF